MIEKYFLNGESLPTIPVPHDCVIKHIRLKEQCIEFVFEDDISYHDSIKNLGVSFKSLKVKYHLVNEDDFSLCKWENPSDDFYRRLDNRELTELTKEKYALEYLYHYVGYSSIIIKLFANGEILLDALVDYVEYEWIK